VRACASDVGQWANSSRKLGYRRGVMEALLVAGCRCSLLLWKYQDGRRERAAATATSPKRFPDAANAAFTPRRALDVCIRARSASTFAAERIELRLGCAR